MSRQRRDAGARPGVVLLGFGEPEGADASDVESFLEKIFLAGAALEPGESGGPEPRARALAAARAPALAQTYRSIGGSPLMTQLVGQARMLEAELAGRGRPTPVTIATQFFRPSMADAADWARDRGVSELVAVPTYPVCGPSTTLAAIESLALEVAGLGGVRLAAVAGWHRHPHFARLWAKSTVKVARERDVDLKDAGTLLYFSAHGIPVKYAEAVPYTRYVEEACGAVAEALGVRRHVLGYQNHGNRPIPWVEPDNRALLPSVDAERVVVVPISFLHEQSETLAELDQDLRGLAMSRGLDFHRVPVPHDEPLLIGLLADLAEGALEPGKSRVLARCTCLQSEVVWCTNGSDRG